MKMHPIFFHYYRTLLETIPSLMKKFIEEMPARKNQSKKDTEPFYDLMTEITIESLKDYKRLLAE